MRGWGSDPECALFWSGVHALFGVFFRQEAAAPASGVETGEESDVQWIRTGPAVGIIPVYFDYSGLWARFGGQPRPGRYPVGLALSSPRASSRALSDAQRWMASVEPDRSSPGPWGKLTRRARADDERRDEEVIQSRTVLRHSLVPPFDGRRIGEVIFIRGKLRTPSSPTQFFNLLTNECGVYPFLFAESGGQVLLAGLGQTNATKPGRVPVPSARRPVMSVVDHHLDRAEVLVEPVEALEELIQHRYPARFPGT
ncbi:MAG: hypothetical protein L3K23_02070 [Thermoplasmata archaeon]|nr:hypothetical protein [Thermoplasmata archaeon]